jgi:hypothetical protein
MNFLGLSITRVKDTDSTPSASTAMAHISQQSSRQEAPSIRVFRKQKITDLIVFPEPENMDDVWQMQALTNLVAKVDTMFNKGWIDICEIDSAITRFKISQNARSRDAYNKLRVLHCVDFTKYLPGIMEEVPDLLTCVFTGGVLPKENFAQRDV